MHESKHNNKIASNTLLLYIRMAIVMVVNLFAVRIVLNSLGASDYGIYNTIAGIVPMLACVTGALSSATLRYYSFALGKRDIKSYENIYSTSLNIYIIFSVIVIVLGETLGLWFVNNKLVIPDGRMYAANSLFHFSIFSFVFTILSMPFSASTIAHEDIKYFSIISTGECIAKFIIALLIKHAPYDGLVYYGFSLMIVPFISLLIYIVICKRKYEECNYHIKVDNSLYRELFSFSGWTLYGSLAGVGMMQINTILVNIFFGPIVNAQRAIALSVNTAVTSFSYSFLSAVNPPLIKSVAGNNISNAKKIFYFSNKFILSAICIIAVPMFYEMDYILKIWLGVVNQDAVIFCRIILIYSVIMSLNNPITTIMQSINRVKDYFLRVESITLLCPVVTYILFKWGFPASATFVAMAAIALIAHVERIVCMKKYCETFSIREYVFGFLFPMLIILLLLCLLLYVMHINISNSSIRLIVSFTTTLTLIPGCVYLWGLTYDEKRIVNNLVQGYIKRIRKN